MSTCIYDVGSTIVPGYQLDKLIFGLKIMLITKKTYTIMILEDEEDILKLYSDYLCSKGHKILRTYVNTETILQDIDIENPDVYIMDYKLTWRHEWD